MAVETFVVNWAASETQGQGNCSVVFFHDEQWWGCFRRGPSSPLDWKFSRYDTGPGDPNLRWKELQLIHDQINNRDNADCIVDSANDRVYIMGQGAAELIIVEV